MGPTHNQIAEPAVAEPVSSRHPVAEYLQRIPGWALLCVSALVYLALSQFVIWLNDPVNLGAGFWPAAGTSLALLLLLPRRSWKWVLGGVAIAEFGGDLAHGYPLAAIVFWTAGNVVEPFVGALLIRRVHENARLVPLRNLVVFLAFGVFVGPLVGATIGSVGSIFFIGNPAWQVWPKYVMGDALGVLVMAPVLLAWTIRSTRRHPGELAVLAGSLIVVNTLVFRNWPGPWDATLPYAIVPFLMWAALRFGMRGAAAASFLVAHAANASTAFGYGPFALAGGPSGHAVTLLQMFLVISIVTTLAVAALTDDLMEKRVAERRLEARNRELRNALKEIRESHLYIRKLEGVLPMCMTCKSVRSDDDQRWLSLDTYLTQSDALSLSHTLCPVCEDRAFAEIDRT